MAESRLSDSTRYLNTGINRDGIFAFGHNGFGQIETDGRAKINKPKSFNVTMDCAEIQDVVSTWRLTILVTNNRIILFGSLEPSQRNQCKTIHLSCMMKKILLSETRDQLIGLSSDGKLTSSETDKLESWKEITSNIEDIWLTHAGILLKESSYRLLISLGDLDSVHFPLDKGVVMKQVSCGHSHSALLTADRMVYTYGAGTRGELGHGDLEGRETPVLLEALGGIPVVQLSSGGWHNLALTENGDVYSWGWNESGQLGLGTAIQVISTPTLLPLQLADEQIEFKKVSCGSRHSCALTRQGQLYTWGWGAYGQLGHQDFANQLNPKLLNLNTEVESAISYTIVDVMAGRWNTFIITKNT